MTGSVPLTLHQKQAKFARLLAQLIAFVFEQGWEVTLGEGYDDDGTGHMQGSLHYSRLAQDLNLFVDGAYVGDGASLVWKRIGEFWEGLDPECAWGGRFTSGDSNHFSLRHEGRA